MSKNYIYPIILISPLIVNAAIITAGKLHWFSTPGWLLYVVMIVAVLAWSFASLLRGEMNAYERLIVYINGLIYLMLSFFASGVYALFSLRLDGIQ